MTNPPKRDSPRKITAIISTVGALVFLMAVWPNGNLSYQWGNFVGAFLVAVGGIAGSLHNLEVSRKLTSPVTWACLVVGGFAIAGASLQAALA